MANSADTLLTFFRTTDGKTRRTIDVYSIFYAIEDLHQTLDVMKKTGHNVDMYIAALSRWKAAVAENLRGDMTWIGQTHSVPLDGDMGLLESLSDRISSVVEATDENVRDQISEFVNKATQALVDDPSLPEDFRWHLAKVLNHVRTCLDEYEIRGDVALADAVERLIGAIRLAEGKSKDGSTWAHLWDEYGKPVATGLFVELTAGAAGLGGLLALSGGASV